MKRWSVGTIALCVIGVGLAAVGPATSESPPLPREAMKALGMTAPPRLTATPNVTMPTLTGGHLALSDLRGRAVLVNFFATWCKACLWEMPLMEKLYQSYKDRGLVVLAISVDQEGSEGPRSFVASRRLTFPVALDPRQEAARQFNVTGIPASILVDPDGAVKAVTYGPKNWDGQEARALITSLLPGTSGGMTR